MFPIFTWSKNNFHMSFLNYSKTSYPTNVILKTADSTQSFSIKPQLLLPLPFRNRHIQFTIPIQFFYKINNQLRRMFFMMHVHEKIQFFQPIFQPKFDSFHPVIAPGKIRWMQAVSYKTDKCFGCG